MSSCPQAELWIGSPRGVRSVSAALGRYLLERLSARGFRVNEHPVYAALGSSDRMAALLDGAMAADLLIVTAPIYVDSLPAGLIEAMEALHTAHHAADSRRVQRLIAITNSGYPELTHHLVAVRMLELLAHDQGMRWDGALCVGAGAALGGGTLVQTGMTRRLRKGLDQAARDLASDQPISAEARQNVEAPLMPAWLYRLAATWHWRQSARRNGVLKRLGDTPAWDGDTQNRRN